MLSKDVNTRSLTTQGTLKQHFLYNQMPTHNHFQTERTLVLQQIIGFITATGPNQFLASGVDFPFLIQRFKMVYGMKKEEMQVLLDLFINILFGKTKLCMEVKNFLVRILTFLLEQSIQIDGFKIDNSMLLREFQALCTLNPRVPNKQYQKYINEYSNFVLLACKHGDDIMQEVFYFAVAKREIRFIALFVKCLQKKEVAEMLMAEMFDHNGHWDKDLNWYFIVATIASKFQKLDFVKYFPQLFLDIVRNINDTFGSMDEMDRIFMEEKTGIQPVVKSMAQAIVWLIVPATKPHCQQVWMYIHRIFNLILSPLDPSNHVASCMMLIEFIKCFVQSFTRRKGFERNVWQHAYNQDDPTNLCSEVETKDVHSCEFLLDEYCLQEFDKLAKMAIKKLVAMQDSVGDIFSIMTLLSVDKQEYHGLILQQILSVLGKEEDLSLETPTSILSYMLELSIVTFPDKSDLIIDCARRLLEIIDKLGLNEHMDLLELVLRMFIYFPKDSPSLDSLKEDLLDLIIANLSTLSTGFANKEKEETELYIEFNNPFNSLFFSLDAQQLSRFKERFIYHVLSGIPLHSQAYESILVICSYLDPTFPHSIMNKIFDQLLKAVPSPELSFLEACDVSLALQNKDTLLWYAKVIECTLQYRPQSIIKYWESLEQLILNLFKNPNNQIFECGYSIIFNLIITLLHKQLPPGEFSAARNYHYQTLELHWEECSKEAINLVMELVNKYVYGGIQFVRNRYKTQLQQKYSNSQLIDGILVQFSGNHHASEERKLLHRVLHIQEAVVTALMPYLRPKDSPFSRVVCNILQNEFLSDFLSLRSDMIQFLSSILHLCNSFGFISDPEIMKTYHGLCSDLHGKSYISDMLGPAEEVLLKLSTLAFPKRSRNCNTSQYVLIGEVLFVYYLRVDFLYFLAPMGQIYDQYLSTWLVLGHHQSLGARDSTIYLDHSVTLHAYHKETLGIWTQKLDFNNPKSYINMRKVTSINKNQRERYENAITDLIIISKKVGEYLTRKCCVQDPEISLLIFRLVQTYEHLQKKKDRVILLDNLFNTFAINFEETLVIGEKEESLVERQSNPHRMSKFQSPLLSSILERQQDSSNTEAINSTTDYEQRNKEQVATMSSIILQCIQAIDSEKQEKSIALYILLSITYSRFLKQSDALLSQLFLALQRVSASSVLEIYQAARMGLFHLVNVTQRANLVFYRVENKNMKVTFDEYLMERNFNIQKDVPASSAFCSKYKYMFFNHPLVEGRIETILSCKASLTPLETTILQFISTPARVISYFEGCLNDPEFTKEDEPSSNSKVLENSQIILNYLLDKDPRKINLFEDLLDSFEAYGTNFYYRLVKKLSQLGGPGAISPLEELAEHFRKNTSDEHQLMYPFIATAIIRSSTNQSFISNYIQVAAECNNEMFTSHLTALFHLFKENPFTVKDIYAKLIRRLREEKGTSRLRHIDVWKIFVLAQGRWARHEAIEGLEWVLQGITGASVDVAQGIVSCLVQCFILPINLHEMSHRVQEDISTLVKQKRLFKASDKIGFQINPRLSEVLQTIGSKIQQERDIESEGLRVYTNIASKILQSLIVYQFNDFFYDMLKPVIQHIIDKSIEDVSEVEILKRLGESEYPLHIYNSLKNDLQTTANGPPLIVRKKLKLLEILMFCRGFSTNHVQIPNIYQDLNNITLPHIVCVSNVLKALTPKELQANVSKAISMTTEDKYPILMSLLLSSGTWAYEWKVEALKVVISWRMKKLVKEFVSYWWKGKGEGSEGEETLAMLVKNVANPYSYFA